MTSADCEFRRTIAGSKDQEDRSCPAHHDRARRAGDRRTTKPADQRRDRHPRSGRGSTGSRPRTGSRRPRAGPDRHPTGSVRLHVLPARPCPRHERPIRRLAAHRRTRLSGHGPRCPPGCAAFRTHPRAHPFMVGRQQTRNGPASDHRGHAGNDARGRRTEHRARACTSRQNPCTPSDSAGGIWLYSGGGRTAGRHVRPTLLVRRDPRPPAPA